MNKSSIHLDSNFEYYRRQEKFIDCVLLSGGKRYPAHRVILAKFCSWFKKYFIEHPKQGNAPLEVELPVDPTDQSLDQFLDIIYRGRAHIDVMNIPPLLKMADFYDVPVLREIMRRSYTAANNDSTLIHFVTEFIKLDLTDDAIRLAPSLARNFKKVLDGEKLVIFTKEQFFNAVSPKVLAAVLNDQCFSNKTQYPDTLKVELIDEFVGDTKITDITDQRALASCIDWTEPNSKYHLVNYRCDWLPSDIAFPLYESLLVTRNRSIIKFNKSIKSSKDKLSRWYLFAWATKIHDSHPINTDDPEFDTISFIRTLGGTTQPFNPQPYGLIKTFISAKPIADPQFGPSNVLKDDTSYFMAQADQNGPPMVGLDFGDCAELELNEVRVDTTTLPRKYRPKKIIGNQYYPKCGIKPFAEKLGISVGMSEDECRKSNPLNAQSKDGKFKVSYEGKGKKCRCISVMMTEPSFGGGNILRISGIEVNGAFK
ncbi:BTB/POZ domain containing protein [Histomonas meleagridis]|uniref:BTB/POZ domain containing protein n=1 Tax=Histomonas meleagridis TaxID=135588 RepID=UPI0035595CA8|nr:BTB/POZ domain containing protein [Histomonas meleagridis]KAH0807110.1 BTB/POZ domain containing protein [Histomonas meleagridis]